MGSNARSEMGLGSLPISEQKRFYAPIPLDILAQYVVTRVCAGSFSLAMTSSKEMLVWGNGDFGCYTTPQKLFIDDALFAEIAISKQAESFCAAIDETGQLYTWGCNKHGQLGFGDFRSRKLPTRIAQLRKKRIK